MMMPRLARGVIRLAPVGRMATGLRMSNYSCKCNCVEGQAVCGTGATGEDAHATCVQDCINYGTTVNTESCNYERGGSCP